MKKTLTLRRHFLQILIPGGLYCALFLARPIWFAPHCSTEPAGCAPDTLNGIDQVALSHHSVFADACSNWVQNGSGVFAFLLPWFLLPRGKVPLFMNLTLLSMTAWNGAFVEIVRALVQRPRPQVFGAPLTEGQNIHLYTSFYSGHTSFVALATLFTFFWVKAEKPEAPRTHRLLFFLYLVLTFATGALRVMGGRHFPTDVIAGWAFGSTICWIVYTRVRRYSFSI
jgi:membrane-associated phospholipid phosphatase